MENILPVAVDIARIEIGHFTENLVLRSKAETCSQH